MYVLRPRAATSYVLVRVGFTQKHLLRGLGCLRVYGFGHNKWQNSLSNGNAERHAPLVFQDVAIDGDRRRRSRKELELFESIVGHRWVEHMGATVLELTEGAET